MTRRYTAPIIRLDTGEQVGLIAFTASSWDDADAKIDQWNIQHNQENVTAVSFDMTSVPVEIEQMGTIEID